MIDYNPKIPLYSLHIHKCGGSSFRQIIKQWFSYGYFPYYKGVINKFPNKRILEIQLKVSKYIPVCIHGHFMIDYLDDFFIRFSNANQFITVLRDPCELHISKYFYTEKVFQSGGSFIGKNGDLIKSQPAQCVDDYLENYSCIMLKDFPWQFNFENYKAILNKNFIHIGTLEQREVSIKILSSKLKKKNIKLPKLNTSKLHHKPSNSSIKIFKSKHSLEYAIYNFAKDLNY